LQVICKTASNLIAHCLTIPIWVLQTVLFTLRIMVYSLWLNFWIWWFNTRHIHSEIEINLTELTTLPSFIIQL